ncbi:ribonuclease H-like domain-containing protein [Tanacetum coccineum]
MYLLVYVDDIILTGNHTSAIRHFISRHNQDFSIIDLGRLNYCLGLEVSYTDSGIFLSQSKYAHDILTRAHLLDVKPVGTPLSTGAHFTTQGTLFSDPTLYRSLVGALQYLTITRPDLSYAVNQITHLLHELHVLPPSRPTILCDNISAIFLSQNPVSHKRAKHIDIDYHFVRELVLSGKLHTKFVYTHLQLVDIFTKSLPRPLFEDFRTKLCVGPPPLRLPGADRNDSKVA